MATVRRHDFTGHRAWMMPAYAVRAGAGTQVFTEGVSETVFGINERLRRHSGKRRDNHPDRVGARPSQLHGLLARIRDLGVTLISVQVERSQPTSDSWDEVPRPGARPAGRRHLWISPIRRRTPGVGTIAYRSPRWCGNPSGLRSGVHPIAWHEGSQRSGTCYASEELPTSR